MIFCINCTANKCYDFVWMVHQTTITELINLDLMHWLHGCCPIWGQFVDNPTENFMNFFADNFRDISREFQQQIQGHSHWNHFVIFIKNIRKLGTRMCPQGNESMQYVVTKLNKAWKYAVCIILNKRLIPKANTIYVPQLDILYQTHKLSQYWKNTNQGLQ